MQMTGMTIGNVWTIWEERLGKAEICFCVMSETSETSYKNKPLHAYKWKEKCRILAEQRSFI